MRMYDIIEKKKNNQKLSKEEIEYWVMGYVNNKIPDYQVASLLMAICFNGLDDEELTNLTMTMASSGEQVDLSSINGKKVDKHSSGGVGDKTTLIVAPIAAACGCKVAKMSGRGLGYTGGTIDKLESIEGYNTAIPRDKFIKQVNDIGISLIGQSGNLTPADKKIYALRDVTATVESIPLIASSIMSKKIAAGSDYIVLDVKMGSGAFMKNLETAKELAQKMVNIGKLAKRNTMAVITNMDVPLGENIGNSLEVIESIDILKGKGPKDLLEVSIVLATSMVMLCKNISEKEAKNEVIKVINNGEAFNKLKEVVKAQSGNVSWIEDTSKFPKAKFKIGVKSPKTGYIKSMQTENIGKVACKLGAGRETKEDTIDYSAGIKILKKTSEFVTEGDIIAILYTNKEEKLDEATKDYLNALEFTNEAQDKPKLIYEIIS